MSQDCKHTWKNFREDEFCVNDLKQYACKNACSSGYTEYNASRFDICAKNNNGMDCAQTCDKELKKEGASFFSTSEDDCSKLDWWKDACKDENGNRLPDCKFINDYGICVAKDTIRHSDNSIKVFEHDAGANHQRDAQFVCGKSDLAWNASRKGRGVYDSHLKACVKRGAIKSESCSKFETTYEGRDWLKGYIRDGTKEADTPIDPPSAGPSPTKVGGESESVAPVPVLTQKFASPSTVRRVESETSRKQTCTMLLNGMHLCNYATFSDVISGDSQTSISGVLARKTDVCVKYGQEGVPPNYVCLEHDKLNRYISGLNSQEAVDALKANSILDASLTQVLEPAT